MDDLVAKFANMPMRDMRRLVQQHPSAYATLRGEVLSSADSLEEHMRTLLCGLWQSSQRQWHVFVQLVATEVDGTASANAQSMQQSIALARTCSVTRLKELARKYGAKVVNATKKRGGTRKGKKGPSEDTDPQQEQQEIANTTAQITLELLSGVLDLLRVEHENDFSEVLSRLQQDIAAKSVKKGFGV